MASAACFIYARDIWPNFISCALVVHEDLIKSNPVVVQDLVRGIAEIWRMGRDAPGRGREIGVALLPPG
jgi:ABC-type nitrate/sulfonate/bicarbonate transport system substrate-binding protein